MAPAIPRRPFKNRRRERSNAVPDPLPGEACQGHAKWKPRLPRRQADVQFRQPKHSAASQSPPGVAAAAP